MKFPTILLLTMISLTCSVIRDIKKSDLIDCTKIGQGANGDVEKCRHPDGTWYAVKGKKVKSLDDKMAMNEINILIELDEKEVPYVAGLKFIDTTRLSHGVGMIYLGFDVFDKGDLSDFIEGLSDSYECKKITEKVALHLIAGLAKIHEAGILHFDIKPENILVNGQNVPYYADFGLSEKYDPRDQGGQIKGTPGFMGPEVFDEHTLGKKTDTWALGVTLIELFKGRNYNSYESNNYALSILSIQKMAEGIQRLKKDDLPCYPDQPRIDFLGIIKEYMVNLDYEKRKDAEEIFEEIVKQKNRKHSIFGSNGGKQEYTTIKENTSPLFVRSHTTLNHHPTGHFIHKPAKPLRTENYQPSHGGDQDLPRTPIQLHTNKNGFNTVNVAFKKAIDKHREISNNHLSPSYEHEKVDRMGTGTNDYYHAQEQHKPTKIHTQPRKIVIDGRLNKPTQDFRYFNPTLHQPGLKRKSYESPF